MLVALSALLVPGVDPGDEIESPLDGWRDGGGAGQVAGLVAVLVSRVGEGDELALGGDPRHLAGDLVHSLAAAHRHLLTALLAEAAVGGLQPDDEK